MDEYINVTPENVVREHLCCAIADKKHQAGVAAKKVWLQQRYGEGHVFRKLNANGKIFIEYQPLESAWVPVDGDGYLYIHCLWVSGMYKEKGHGRALLAYCLQDAREQGKKGVCVLASAKKMPFLSDKRFFQLHGFKVADKIGDYELLAITFDEAAAQPKFRDNARQMRLPSQTLTIYYDDQCPYIHNCLSEIEAYCRQHDIPLELIVVDTLEKAKAVPCVFNNWAVFYKGQFRTLHLLNQGYLIKMLAEV